MRTWTWMLLLAVSCWRLHFYVLFAGCVLQAILFSLKQSGFSDMDARGNLEEDPFNLLGGVKLKVRRQVSHQSANVTVSRSRCNKAGRLFV